MWVRQDGPGFITSRRSETSRFNGRKGIVVGIYTKGDFDVPVKKIHPSLGSKSNVAVVIELLTNGRVHERQYGRLPFIGLFLIGSSALDLQSDSNSRLRND